MLLLLWRFARPHGTSIVVGRRAISTTTTRLGRPTDHELIASSQQQSVVTARASSSDVYQIGQDVRLNDLASANQLVDHFRQEERALLLKILMEREGVATIDSNTKNSPPTFSQLKQVFMINTIPFIGFGILDNMIMLLAGEYIDQTLGALLGISTMAAAALGNIISDVAGVGLAHYVEKIVSKLGFGQPDLSPNQLEMKQVRFTVNWARAFGLVIGCIIGMFPLLFFDDEHGHASVPVSAAASGNSSETATVANPSNSAPA